MASNSFLHASDRSGLLEEHGSTRFCAILLNVDDLVVASHTPNLYSEPQTTAPSCRFAVNSVSQYACTRYHRYSQR